MKKLVKLCFFIPLLIFQPLLAQGFPYFRLSEVPDTVRICALRVEFQEDTLMTTTGNGKFLTENQGYQCADLLIDPPPHNRAYFKDHIRALSNYYYSVSHGKCIIDTTDSEVFPLTDDEKIVLSKNMAYYSSFDEPDSQDFRLVKLFEEAVQYADQNFNVDFSKFDLVVVFHAGLGQDFQIFLDRTPRDISSAYIGFDDISSALGATEPDYAGIGTNDGVFIKEGIILPETQNFLLFDNWDDVIEDTGNPCHYQFGLNGTFAFMVGYYLGLPGLYNTENNFSGIGKFGLMDQGSSNFYGLIPAYPSAWERISLGWEIPISLPENDWSIIPSVNLNSDSSSWIIPINSTEYYLIENRNNHILPGVSFDSLIYRNYEQDSTLNPFNVLKDTMEGNFSSETGVLLSVENYDWGIPGSGLLIWHIDDRVIMENITSNQVNANPERFGVDLEEADGAQDLGYPSPFFSAEMESGWMFDAWYAGNPAFFHLNPTYPKNEIKSPGFTPFTHPNTNSNDGTRTLISLTDIGIAGERMPVFFSKSIPHKRLQIRAEGTIHANSFDIDSDNIDEIVLIADSLYVFKVDRANTNSFPAFKSAGEHAVSKVYLTDSGKNLAYFSQSEVGDSLILYLKNTDSLFNQTRVWQGEFLELSSNPVFTEEGFICGMRDASGTVWLVSNSDRVQLDVLNLINLPGTDTVFAFGRDGSLEAIEYSNGLQLQEVADLPGEFNLPAVGIYLDNGSVPDFAAVSLDGQVYLVENGDPRELTVLRQTPLFIAGSYSSTGNLISIGYGNQIVRYYPSGALAENFPVTVPPPWTEDSLSSEFVQANFEDGNSWMGVLVPGRGIFLWNENSESAEFSPITYDGNCNAFSLLKNNGTWLWLTDTSGVIDAYKLNDDFYTSCSWFAEDGKTQGSYFMDAPYTEQREEGGKFFRKGSVYSYPNPVYGNITMIRFLLQKEADVRISVYDLAGDLIKKENFASPYLNQPSEYVLDTSSMQSGVYLVNVEAKKNNSSQTETVKVMVIH